MQGFWTVRRHGGRSCDTWRVICQTTDEAEAREVYQRTYVAMRQGGVELYAPDGTLLRHQWAPRLRTRW